EGHRSHGWNWLRQEHRRGVAGYARDRVGGRRSGGARCRRGRQRRTRGGGACVRRGGARTGRFTRPQEARRGGVRRRGETTRIRSQLALPKKVAVATYAIDNSNGLDRLRARVADLYAELVVTYGSPGRRPE